MNRTHVVEWAGRKSMRVLVFAGVLLALSTGCVVNSVYPFFTQADLLFDPALVGWWMKPDEQSKVVSEAWLFERTGLKRYKLTVHGHDGVVSYEAHLFGLEGQVFLDLLPVERKDGFAPTHTLLRVRQIDPTLQISTLNYGWLRELLERNPAAVRHHRVLSDSEKPEEYQIVLAAETAELQAFLRRHLEEPSAFVPVSEMERWIEEE